MGDDFDTSKLRYHKVIIMTDAAGAGKNVRINDVWTNSYHGACRIIR